MKMKALIQPGIRTTENARSSDGDDVFPNSSAIVGTTLLGDLEDALAVLRTVVLLSRNLGARLFLGLPGMDVLPVHFDEAPQFTSVSELLDSTRTQLGGLNAMTFAVEVNIVAASFVCSGSITMRVRSTNPVLASYNT
jgi:hypothetical protein